MIRGGHCFDVSSTEADGEVEGRKSCLGAQRRPSKSCFLRDPRVFENERRRLRGMETNVCGTSAGKNPLGRVRHLKKVVRRSSALVKGRKPYVENSCCCSDSASPEPPCCHSRMNVVHDCGGSILRGKTRGAETQTSRSHSGGTSPDFSRTKGSGNWRTESRSKFPPATRISSAVVHRSPRYGTPSSDKCCCSSNTGLKKSAKNYQQIRFRSQNHFPMSNDRVITTASTSEEEIIDYQVPVQPCSSSHRLCETRSETKTLVPTSSHVTIRICSQDSNSSLRCDRFDDEEDGRPRFSRSENSLNRLEERVRRGLRAMCCCDQPGDDNLEGKLDEDGVSFKPGSSSLTECQISSNNFTPRSGKKSRCCKCGEAPRPRIGFVESSEEGAFRRFKDVINETRRRRGQRRTTACHSGPKTNRPKYGRTMCEPTRPRRVVPRRLPTPRDIAANIDPPGVRSSFQDPPIILSAQRYKEFVNRCECIRNSIGNTAREENVPGCEPPLKEAVAWKGDAMNLGDFKPDLPPLQHWSQYEDGMRKVTDEYRTLRSCVNLMEAEAEKESPSCCCTEKSVTRTYPSGTEFTFRVKRAPEPVEEPGSKKSGPMQRSRDFRAKGRSVCFEKSKREKQPCCDCPKDVKPRCNVPRDDGMANIEAMRTREADLVRTLETFCEKMKSMKSEFDKSSNPGPSKDSGYCRSCGRDRRSPGCNRMKAKKLLIFPPEGEDGPPLTLYKNSSSVNCRVKGDPETGLRYNVIYIQRFVSSSWNPDKGTDKCCMDSG